MLRFFLKQTKNFKRMSSDNTCAICYEEMDTEKNCATTECGHKFCLTCILKAAQQNTACPLCRNVLVPPKTHNESELRSAREIGYGQGYEHGRDDQRREDDEEMDIRVQREYDRGFSQGMYRSREQIADLRSEINRLQHFLTLERENCQERIRVLEEQIAGRLSPTEPLPADSEPNQEVSAPEPAPSRSLLASNAQEFKELPTNSRAEALRSSRSFRPSWIRNHQAFGARWQA